MYVKKRFVGVCECVKITWFEGESEIEGEGIEMKERKSTKKKKKKGSVVRTLWRRRSLMSRRLRQSVGTIRSTPSLLVLVLISHRVSTSPRE